MKIGACRRAFTTRSSRPLPRIGSVLAVQVTTMSNSGRRSGISFSVIASAPKRAASSRPRSSVRLAIVIDFGARAAKCVAVSSIMSPAPISSSRCLGDRRKDPLGELHGGRGHRDRRAADVRLRAHVLGDGERALEQPIQHEAEAAGGGRVPHRLLHLAQDLRLAQHHRVEPARHAERVRDRPVARQRVDVRRQRVRGHPVKLLEPAHHRLRVRAVDVHLGTVARRQDRGFPDLRPGEEVAQRVAQRVRRERDLLPHVQRCGLVVQAEGIEGHRESRL